MEPRRMNTRNEASLAAAKDNIFLPVLKRKCQNLRLIFSFTITCLITTTCMLKVYYLPIWI